MSRTEHIRVSFEGERGSGKTTAISTLVGDLEKSGYKVQVNRKVATVKLSNLSHLKSIDFHKGWKKMVMANENPALAEAMAFAKYHHALAWFLEEEEMFDKIIKENDVFICDRDIDTTVLYAAIEVILSNPNKYNNETTKTELLDSLWAMVSSVRNFPDITFCFTSSNPTQTLERSYLSKRGTNEEYNLDQVQEHSQVLASKMLIPVISRRPLHRENVFLLNIDDKSPRELELMVLNKLQV